MMNRLGRTFSMIVYQNISIVISAGIINILFGQNGWWPDAQLSQFIDPLYHYVIPLLLAYTGGKIYGGQRGGIIASVSVLGLIISSEIPMIVGAILFSPLIGRVFHYIETRIKHFFPIGTELLFRNLTDACLSIIFMFFFYKCVGPLFNISFQKFSQLMIIFIESGWLPFVSIIIEPAKVLFFNNVINHGIVGPLGIQQTKDLGKSIFFLLEANPGPGLGVLLAYYWKVKKERRFEIKTTMGIQAIGGIHEVYFPYVLMRPILLIPLIVSGFTGNTVFNYFHTGLVSTASPGSVIFILFLAPKANIVYVLFGILASASVSFLLSYLLLPKKVSLHNEREDERIILQDMLGESQLQTNGLRGTTDAPPLKNIIKHVTFACDGGLGSSAMGAAILKKRLNEEPSLTLEVNYASIDEIPLDTDLIISHQQFKERIISKYPEKHYIGLSSLSNREEYGEIMDFIKLHQ